MKNIHVLPTDKPSRLYKSKITQNIFISNIISQYGDATYNQHIYITSDEEITGFENNIWVIKGERIFLWQNTMALVSNNKPKKIILTTDQDLIADGVQAIDDTFLEWFVKNPTCEEVKVKNVISKYFDCVTYIYKIIIPQEEPKQEFCDNCGNEVCCCVIKNLTALDEAAEKYSELQAGTFTPPHKTTYQQGFEDGAKWQSERMYSEEETVQLLIKFNQEIREVNDVREWFEQFKK